MSDTHILCLDDNDDFREMLTDMLDAEGFNVHPAPSIRTAFEILDRKNIDIILLDMQLNESEDGLSVLRRIRQTRTTPVVMLSGKDEDVDRIMCIEAGADDYVVKPFVPRELTARIRAVLRRSNSHSRDNSSGDYIKFDGWTIDRKKYDVTDKNGKSADLTTKEFQMLEKLALSVGQTLSRDQLHSLFHTGNEGGFDRAIDIGITRIRKKLGDDPQSPKYIRTVRGIGYLFVANVEKG